MRRKDREITDINEILKIVEKCDVCRLAFFDDTFPYIIPMNFGFSAQECVTFYFHTAYKGKKIDLLRKNNSVSFEMDCDHKLVLGERACDATMEFQSVCGNGFLELVEDDKKAYALNVIMNNYQKNKNHDFTEKDLKGVLLLKLKVNEITGKRLKI